MFKLGHLFSWYLSRLHDLEEAKKNFGTSSSANNNNRSSRTSSSGFKNGEREPKTYDRDSDSFEDLEETQDDLTDVDVDIEFTVQ